MYDYFFKEIESVLNIKENAKKALLRLGIKTVKDLLFYSPYTTREIYVEPILNNKVFDNDVIKTVQVATVDISQRHGKPSKVICFFDGYIITMIFFNPIPAFITQMLKPQANITIFGKLQFFQNQLQIVHPEIILKKELITNIEPIYHLTYGMTNLQLRSYIHKCVSEMELEINTIINNSEIHHTDNIIYLNEVRYAQKLSHLIKITHYLGDITNPHIANTAFHDARKELAAFELFANQIKMKYLRQQIVMNSERVIKPCTKIHEKILNGLGFELTKGQKHSLNEIIKDQKSKTQMMRMLQGDVGSGKTLVALLTMLNVVLSGYQTCLMAPTDLLSKQHYEFFIKACEFSEAPINIKLLTGKTSSRERKKIDNDLKNGDIQILIGTHALFQESVIFANLSYIVIDEQHRFGVQQRLNLINKAKHPDLLVMTATPIPRSLTLTMFGDMSVSKIDSKPKDRLPIITKVMPLEKKNEVIRSIENILSQKQKIYWICPLIDVNDKLNEDKKTKPGIYADVVSAKLNLDTIYPNRVDFIHGKIKSNERDRIMYEFKNGAIDILVATTVIEVGIDISDATLIVIENAEKFGLSQLHQLRGRVGRGSHQSYCILLYNNNRLSKIGKKRLKIMCDSDNGFYIAEQDLILRGGGEILGTKQSGEQKFHFADLAHDTKQLINANKIAQTIDENKFIDFQIKLFANDDDEILKSG